MFIGEYTHNIDEKGRLQIPAKFRAKLASGAVVTRGLDNCLFLYPKEEWERIAEKIANLPLSNAASRSFSRLLLAGAMEVELDKQGRVILPSFLRQYAGMKKVAVLAGLWGKVEIWSEENWSTYKEKSEKEVEQNISQLEELGI